MTASRIPIQNLYYLLCYAWNHLEQGELIDVSKIPSNELVDLFAVVLCQGLEHLARRGLEQGYELHEEELAGVRGRIDPLRSGRRFLPEHGRAACIFDELSVNTLPNRIIKNTLRLLDRFPALNSTLKKKVNCLRNSLPGIADTGITIQSFNQVQLHSNNRFYRFLLSICKLIHESALIEPNSGMYKFRDFVRDEKAMARVFQDFLYNFIRLEAPEWVVKSENIYWNASSETDPKLDFLPRMQTDISIRRGFVKVIIDAKYYGKTMSNYYETEKFHSANLYQLLSYLSNSHSEGEQTSGMLIYPQVEKPLREKYKIMGYEISLVTLNLDQSWENIHKDLTSLISELHRVK